MNRLKQIILILVSIVSIVALFIHTPTSEAAGEENLTMATIVDWITSGSAEYLNMDATKMLQLYGILSQGARLDIGPYRYDTAMCNIRTNDCLSDAKLYCGNAEYIQINCIIDVDSTGNVTWYSYHDTPGTLTEEEKEAFRQLARYAVGQIEGHANSFNVGKYVCERGQLFRKFFAADFDLGGGAWRNQARDIPDGETVRFMEVRFLNGSGGMTRTTKNLFWQRTNTFKNKFIIPSKSQ